ncbi:MAG: YdeI/OmpD-associated family protein [Ferruginibacter sp.]
MIKYSTIIQQFEEQGEKTGWTYITVPAVIAQQLKPGNKKSFRVKGKLDLYPIEGIALMPMGEGNFIMALNADIRRAIKKRKGAKLEVQLSVDNKPITASPELTACLEDEPAALEFFNTLAQSHRTYFIKWVASAKTEMTRTKRIAQMVTALAKGWGFAEMVRAGRKNPDM